MSAARQVSAGRYSSGTECQAVHALIDCVAPLVRDLRERGLVSSYFFVNHWADAHIRLRLRPTGLDHLDEIGRTAESAMARFLARHEPAPDEPEDCLTVDHLVLLYTDEERGWISEDTARHLPGRTGGRVRYLRHEPEYDRYGGPAGIELAEWHFEHSSDVVLDLAQSVDAHTRQVMLGLSAQLIMIMTAAFLPDTPRLAAYLAELGHGASSGCPDADTDDDEVSSLLRGRFAEIRAAAADPTGEGAAGYRPGDPGGDWARHCHELHGRVQELRRAGELVFPSPAGRLAAVTDEDDLLPRLLTPYLRATNNRLGAGPADETYVAHLLARALGA
jgi:hypothetical protein